MRLARRFVLTRLLLMVTTVLGARVIVFFVIRVNPGDICPIRCVDHGADLDPALLTPCRTQLGRDRPLHMPFVELRDTSTVQAVARTRARSVRFRPW